MSNDQSAKFDWRWFAGALAAMGLAFVACLVGTEAMSHGQSRNLQAMTSVALLTVLPFALAGLLAMAAWLARRHRAKLLGACAGFALAGAVFTGVMFANANRRAAVLGMFQDRGAEGAENTGKNVFRASHAEMSAANTQESHVTLVLNRSSRVVVTGQPSIPFHVLAKSMDKGMPCSFLTAGGGISRKSPTAAST